MKKLLLIALLAPLMFLAVSMDADLYVDPSAVPGTNQEDSLISRLDWMGGRWEIESASAEGDSAEGEQYLEETWSPAREDAMVGCFRWSRGGGVWLYELMSIETDKEHGLVFRLRHFSRNLKGWDSEKDGPLTFPLKDMGDNYAIFENPERDDPRRMVYRRTGDELTVRLENAEGVDKHPFTFKLAKSE
ncbi:MAG: hypothetical protein ACI8QS_000037 [Planctomycetota bacterium]|jgi:hypothetical protein